jgi:hypothetical protein
MPKPGTPLPKAAALEEPVPARERTPKPGTPLPKAAAPEEPVPARERTPKPGTPLPKAVALGEPFPARERTARPVPSEEAPPEEEAEEASDGRGLLIGILVVLLVVLTGVIAVGGYYVATDKQVRRRIQRAFRKLDLVEVQREAHPTARPPGVAVLGPATALFDPGCASPSCVSMLLGGSASASSAGRRPGEAAQRSGLPQSSAAKAQAPETGGSSWREA